MNFSFTLVWPKLIPITIPLFDKAERKSIGIAYHQEGSRSATGIGLSLAVPRVDQFLTGFFRIVVNRWVTVSGAATHYLWQTAADD